MTYTIRATVRPLFAAGRPWVTATWKLDAQTLREAREVAIVAIRDHGCIYGTLHIESKPEVSTEIDLGGGWKATTIIHALPGLVSRIASAQTMPKEPDGVTHIRQQGLFTSFCGLPAPASSVSFRFASDVREGKTEKNSVRLCPACEREWVLFVQEPA